MRLIFAILLFLAVQLCSHAASPASSAITDLQITERGPDHRVVQYKSQKTNERNEIIEKTHSYTELATGLNYRKNGEWIASNPEIIVGPDGSALAHQARHSIRFKANLNTDGAVDLTTPQGKRIRSHVLGVFYYDGKKKESAQVALVKDQTGK